MARELVIGGAWYNYGQDVELYYGFDFGLSMGISLEVTSAVSKAVPRVLNIKLEITLSSSFPLIFSKIVLNAFG